MPIWWLGWVALGLLSTLTAIPLRAQPIGDNLWRSAIGLLVESPEVKMAILRTPVVSAMLSVVAKGASIELN
jgi:hypothetical protein